MIIKQNAVFIADVHFNSLQKEILELLRKIKNHQIEISQLFLMGDIFDFLCDEVEYFTTINYELIDLINTIALQIEVIYFEGNHDYNLQNLFPKVQVISRKQQPFFGNFEGKKIALAHGDIFTPKSYEIYTAIIRNPFFLSFLNLIDFDHWLSQKVETKLKYKNICHKMENFEQFVTKRKEHYQCDLIIEGHFHQGYLSDSYINLPSFACEQKYMFYHNQQFKFIQV